MTKDIQSLSSSIIEISSKDNVTKEITMIVHKLDMANGNGLDFKEEYVEKFKDTLVNKPVVAKYLPISDDLGDHEPIFDSKGNIIGLETIAIGTIKEVWIDELTTDSTVKALYAKADLWNYKYPEIITCVEKLFNSNNADSSVEVEIYAYGENPSQEYRYATSYSYLSNCLLGSTVTPADDDAGIISISQKEIANAVKIDLQNLENEQKGEEEMSEKEVFNKGYEIKYNGQLETSSLKFSEISNQIYNLLNPINAKSGYRKYNYYIREMYVDYVIVEEEDNYTVLWKIPYRIENDLVTLSLQDEWTKGSLGFIPDNIDLEQLQSQVTELNNQITKIKEEAELQMSKTVEELQADLSAKETEVAEFKSKVEELEQKVTELNETIVSQQEAKALLDSQITELNSSIEELSKYKEQVETAEKEAKVAELASRYEKLLSEETFKSEDVQNAIQELNSQKLNEIVVTEVAKQKAEVEVSSAKTDDIVVIASKQEDLVNKDKHDFWASPRL